MPNRCSNLAGLEGLSAFSVASSKSSRRGPRVGAEDNALRQMERWASVGGLKDESRIKRVRAACSGLDEDGEACAVKGGMVWRTRKVACEEVKAWREAAREEGEGMLDLSKMLYGLDVCMVMMDKSNVGSSQRHKGSTSPRVFSGARRVHGVLSHRVERSAMRTACQSTDISDDDVMYTGTGM